MVYKALLLTDDFWISYIKWYKFYDNNLSVVLRCKQGGCWNSWTPDTMTERQFNSNFLVYFAKMLNIFKRKQTKEKLWNALSAWRNFCVDLTCVMGNICQFSCENYHSRMRLFYDMKSHLCNIFILKCVSITNISIEHYHGGCY